MVLLMALAEAGATAVACDLNGKYYYSPSMSLDIVMQNSTHFSVTVDPPSAWKSAVGEITENLWNGTAKVHMTAVTGLVMDGWAHDACSVISANIHSSGGSWIRGSPKPPSPFPPASPTPKPTPTPTVAPTPLTAGDDVVWTTPSTNSMGSMPLGNGRLAMNVWAESEESATVVKLLLSHSDAIEENGILSKLGRVVIRVNASEPSPRASKSFYDFYTGAVGDSSSVVAQLACGTYVSSCAARAQAACDAHPACVGFGLSPIYPSDSAPPSAQLYSSTTASADPWWSLWLRRGLAPRPVAPTPVPAPTPVGPTVGLVRTAYHLHNASVTLQLQNAGVTMTVWVDADKPLVHIESEGTEHSVSATLELWRNATRPYANIDSGTWCSKYHRVLQSADVVESDGPNDSLVWHHRNPVAENRSVDPFWIDVREQNMLSSPHSALAAALQNSLDNLTFGGMIAAVPASGTVLRRVSSHTGAGTGTGTGTGAGAGTGTDTGTSAELDMRVETTAAWPRHSLVIAADAFAAPSAAAFVSSLRAAAANASALDAAAHSTAWARFWAGGGMRVRGVAAPNDTSLAAGAATVDLLDRIDRASFHMMAGSRKYAIKFNAYGIFSSGSAANPDDRVWGPCQWFQNIRLPYYHMLADGRFEDMKSLFEFYRRLLPLAQARAAAWFPDDVTATTTSAAAAASATFADVTEADAPPLPAWFPETMTQYGTYASGSFGWSCAGANATTPMNRYIRYHREGGLELSLLAVDWAQHTQDWAYFRTALLPQVEAYVHYYSAHFAVSDKTRRLDIFPAQALETWQCAAMPPTRDQCVTNPMPEIAGLRALLPRLLALPTEAGVSDAARARWKELLTTVPPVPIGAAAGATVGATVLRPGAQLPAKPSNAENAGLYAVHPYRLAGLFSNRTLGRNTYAARRSKGDTGWSQDLLDTALLGMATDAAAMAVSRAQLPPYAGFRWPGFQAGIGAGGPITDHGGVATAGLRYMLVQTGMNAGDVNDYQPSDMIVLFPAWPCQDWEVSFTLHAPGQTVVSGHYTFDGDAKKGILANFSVVPASRKSDVFFAGCVKAGEVAWAEP